MKEKKKKDIYKIYHSYSAGVARLTGSIISAVIFRHICFWLEINERKKQNYINDKYWTYSTIADLHEVFPEFSSHQISFAIKKLKELNLIELAQLSSNKWNHTNWYSLTQKGKSIAVKCDFDLTEMDDRNDTVVDFISDDDIDNSAKNIYNNIMVMFNSICVSLSRIDGITSSRTKAIDKVEALINGDFKSLFQKVEKSDFLSGRIKGSNWKASFDWIMKEDNAIKIIEGKYDNRKVDDDIGQNQGTFDFTSKWVAEETHKR